MSRSAVSTALYRSMWRWVRSPGVRTNLHFSIPFHELPASVVDAANKLEKSPRGAPGCEALIRLAWREAVSRGSVDSCAAGQDDAFRVLRVMSNLSDGLMEQMRQRLANANRTGIQFLIGEVVRHKVYGYRGVIVGWDRRAAVDVAGWDGLRKSSLGAEQPFYHLFPDESDCTELFGSPRDMKYVAEENLERTVPQFSRIRHPSIIGASAFMCFDPSINRFVPADELAYLYPGSLSSRDPLPPPSSRVRSAASRVFMSVTSAAKQLHTFVKAVKKQEIVQDMSTSHPSGSQHLRPKGSSQRDEPPTSRTDDAFVSLGASRTRESASLASSPEVMQENAAVGMPPDHKFPGGEEPHIDGQGRQMFTEILNLTSSAAMHADTSAPARAGSSPVLARGSQALAHTASSRAHSNLKDGLAHEGEMRQAFDSLRRYAELAEYVSYNLAERAKKADRTDISFGIGQVLRHRKFRFRAVVFGWDRRPSLDVSGWDGVLGLPSGVEQPFYRMVPDMSDCISMLGGPRGIRYVAQENLEPISPGECAISHELLPHIFDGFDAATGTFLPVQQLCFWYGSDPILALPQHTARTVALVAHTISRLEALIHCYYVDAKKEELLDPLLELLTAAPSADDAQMTERACLALLTAHPNGEIMNLMRSSESSLHDDDLLAARGALEEAMDADESHAELYVRRATIALKAGEYESAREDARKALAIDRRHFGALFLEGTALRELRRYEEAITAHQAVLAMHPWASRVVVLIYKAERARRILGNLP